MDNFVTIKTFNYSNEVAIIRARLESEGIECFIKDELTIQLNPFYSNTIGGVKLQVRQHDVPLAIEILKDTGYLSTEVEQPSLAEKRIARITSVIPFINKLPIIFRLLIVGGLAAAIVVVVIYLMAS